MKVLVIAPHSDDEVLGAGGTIKKRSLAGEEIYVCVVTKGEPPLFMESTKLLYGEQIFWKTIK